MNECPLWHYNGWYPANIFWEVKPAKYHETWKQQNTIKKRKKKKKKSKSRGVFLLLSFKFLICKMWAWWVWSYLCESLSAVRVSRCAGKWLAVTGSLYGNTQTRGNGPTTGPAALTPPLSHRSFQAFWKSSAFALCVCVCFLLLPLCPYLSIHVERIHTGQGSGIYIPDLHWSDQCSLKSRAASVCMCVCVCLHPVKLAHQPTN